MPREKVRVYTMRDRYSNREVRGARRSYSYIRAGVKSARREGEKSLDKDAEGCRDERKE